MEDEEATKAAKQNERIALANSLSEHALKLSAATEEQAPDIMTDLEDVVASLKAAYDNKPRRGRRAATEAVTAVSGTTDNTKVLKALAELQEAMQENNTQLAALIEAQSHELISTETEPAEPAEPDTEKADKDKG